MNQEEKKQLLKLANYYFQNDHYPLAETILKKIIAASPNNSNANELLAYIYGNKGELDSSLHYLELATKQPDSSPEACYYLGCLQLKKNMYVEAIDNFNLSILKGGEFFEALHDIGSAYAHLEQNELALEQFKKCLAYKKNSFELYLNIGGMLDRLGRYEEALIEYEKAILLNPNHHEGWHNKGISLNNLNRHEEALNNFDEALKYQPNYAKTWANKGNALGKLKRYNQALTHYDHAISLDQNYYEAWSNKGVILSELKRHDEALLHFDKALQLNHNYANAWSCRGMTLSKLKRYKEALDMYERALQINPNISEAWSSKAEMFENLKLYDKATECYEKVMRLGTDENYSYGQILHAQMKMCKWSQHNQHLDNCLLNIQNNKKIIQPFALLSLIDSPAMHKKCAEIFAKDRYPENLILGPLNNMNKREKIRIGYFSADFKDHPVSFLTVEMFELHDKTKFETIAFSFSSNENSKIQTRLSNSFDQFFDVSNKCDQDIAILARNLEIDIAIDLGGFTAGSPLSIFAFRVAPIQVSYIGYIGTLATNYIDYVIGDRFTIPSASENFFSEKIIRLPFFQANDRKREIAEKNFRRSDLGLPDHAFVFCCFNNTYKITPTIFNSWMNILDKVAGSVLFLYAENSWAEANLRYEAELKGISKERLIFGKVLPRDEYMSRYLSCDLFLDTFPYNAGTTASDALWMGLPVLTYSGNSFASRMAGSLLQSLDLDKLVTNSLEDYEETAVFLAKNPNELSSIKKELHQNKATYPLFNTNIFTKNLEKAYEVIFQNFISGKPPDHVEII